MEHFLEIFFSQNVLIVEILFGIILVGLIYLTYRSFSQPELSEGSFDLKGIEEGIKRILQDQNPSQSSIPSTKGSSGSHSAAPPVPPAPLTTDKAGTEALAELQKIKSELAARNQEIETLRAQAASGGSSAGTSPVPPEGTSGDTGRTQQLEEKVKDLEAKLSEYAIIEDDIADLSFYKDETARLQAEVERLKVQLEAYEKSGGTVATSVSPPPISAATSEMPKILNSNPEFQTPPASTPESVPEIESQSTNEKLVAESPALKTITSQTQETKGRTEPVPPPQVPFEPLEKTEVDDDIMAEFERAVAEQKAVSNKDKISRQVPAVDTEAVANTTPPHNENSGETNVSSDESTELQDASTNLGEINLDKMVTEAESLPDAETVAATNALDQALDADKLLEEATGMTKLDNEAINEFDQFLKKEGA